MKHDIADAIIDLVGIDIFKNTRQREYSDARSLLVKILVDEYKMGWTEIANFFTERGKPMKSHASIIHLYNLFPEAVLRSNVHLTSIYNHLMNIFQSDTATENVIERIRNIEHPRKFELLEKALDEIGI